MKVKIIALIVVIFTIFSSLTCTYAADGENNNVFKVPRARNFNPQDTANEIEQIVNAHAVISAEVTDGKISIKGDEVKQKYENALEEMRGYIEELNNKDLYLDRELSCMVTVHAGNADLSDFTSIIIDNENLSKITDVKNLKVAMKNEREYIILNSEALGYISENYHEFNLQLRNLSGTYTARFLDSRNNIIEKYGTDIKLAFPADHSEQTVYLFMNNTQENWGGQYNGIEDSIEIMTKYSGEYNVASPQIEIGDIDDLGDYEKQAVRFMTARDYFDLDEGKFHPGSTLTRYSFAESLVRMFFALDSDAVCTFGDVDRENYRYVAASQQNHIVEGFSDGTFRGNQNVTVEQVIALTARTINQKNGYVYPEQINKYLNFAEDNVISSWAQKEVALAVREGIYSSEMNLRFSGDIQRKDAAVILYRLFMIMNNTPGQSSVRGYNNSNMDYHKTLWTRRNSVLAVTISSAVDLAALAAGYCLLRKRRTK